MYQQHHTIHIDTAGTGFTNITPMITHWIKENGFESGLITLLLRHTSASLTIQENADPDVLLDLTTALDRLAPSDMRLYRHVAEGPDDMPAHIKASLTDVSLSIPVLEGRMRLGIWQAIYLVEHRTHPHRRQIACHFIGD